MAFLLVDVLLVVLVRFFVGDLRRESFNINGEDCLFYKLISGVVFDFMWVYL